MPSLRWMVFVSAVALAATQSGCGEREFEESVPVLYAKPELRIGSVDGEDASAFGRVTGLAVDDDGRIYVADFQAHEIRAFGPDGTHLYSFAREGRGPGEVREPCCLAFAPDGLLWARDTGNGRFVSFEVTETGATFSSSHRTAHSAAGRHVTTVFDESGRLVDVGEAEDPSLGELRGTLFFLRPGGEVERRVFEPEPANPDELIHEVPIQVGEITFRRYFYPPFGPRHRVAFGPGGVHADVVTSRYEVRWFDDEGSLMRTVQRPEKSGPRLTAAQRSIADSMLAMDAQVANEAMPFDVPDRHPPVRGIHFDAQGRLWVRTTALPGEPSLVDVFDHEGALAEQIVLPPDLDLTYAVLRPDRVVAIGRDEFGVEYVVVLRVETGR